MRRILTASALLFAGALLLAEHELSAPKRAAATVEAPAAPMTDHGGCAAPAPRPLLMKEDYQRYSFEFGPENTSLEKASTGTLSIEIQTSGCHDGVERGFLFENDAADADYTDRDHWLAYAGQQLRDLKTYRRSQEDVLDILSFLAAAKNATTRMNASELRLEVCRDRSAPTEDGCSYESGGGYRFAVRRLSPQSVGVYVSRYYALAKG